MDFSNEFDGPIFKPLKNVKYFKSFIIEGNTVSWDNGADFAPEYLYQIVKNRTATGTVYLFMHLIRKSLILVLTPIPGYPGIE